MAEKNYNINLSFVFEFIKTNNLFYAYFYNLLLFY